jgi:hypothetical protein
MSLFQGNTYSLLILQFSNLVTCWKFLFLRPFWLYVSRRLFSRLVELRLCCRLVPCCLFTDCTGSNLLSSTSPHPCLHLPLFPLPWPLVGLVIWIMIFFCKINEDLLGALVEFFHYPKALHHVFFEMQSGISKFVIKT